MRGVRACWRSFCKPITDAGDGFDVDGALAKLAPQRSDVDVHGAGLAVEVVAPDLFEELVAAEDDLRLAGEGFEQVEFLAAEVDGLAADVDFAPLHVDDEVAGADGRRFGGGRCSRGAAEDGFDAGDDFAWVEGFGDVVIGTELQPDDFVDVVVAGGEHQDGEIGVVASSHAAADVPAVDAGQHQVEDEQVDGRDASRRRRAVSPSAGFFDGEVLLLEVHTQECADVVFVIDDEDAVHWLNYKSQTANLKS